MGYCRNIKLTIVLMSSIIGILISSYPAFSSSVSLTPEEQQWLSQHKTIRVSGPQAFPPFQFFNGKGEHVGIATDYLQKIAVQLGITLEYLPKMPWAKALELTQNKEIDLLSCASVTKERSKYLLFSSPHITFPLVIISRKDAPEIKKLQDIGGMRIALKKKVTIEASLNNSQIAFTPHYVPSPKDALKAVSLGEAEVAIENLAAASYIMEQEGYANLKIAAPTDLDDYVLAIAIRKDWPLFQSIINKSLATISEQQHREIRQRWISVRYEHGITFTDVLKWVAFSLLLSSVIIGTIILWNRRLIGEIRERKKIEVRLRESEEKFKAVYDASFGGIIIHEQGVILVCNQGLSDMTGFSNEELVGMDGFKLIDPDYLDQVLKNVKSGYDQSYEVKGLRKDGSVYPLAIRGKNIHYKDRDARVIEFRDITERKRAEESLRESEERFRELADLLPQTVFEADVRGNLTYVNQMGFESTGYSLEDIEKGLNVIQVILPEDQGKLLKNFARIIEERINYNNEYLLLKKDSTVFPGIIYSRPIIQNDKVVGLRGIVADISDRKRIEEEKEELQSQLRQTYKMEAIGTMAGGIAHDFNNMLAIIIGNADMALDDITEGHPGRYNINQIMQASQRLKDLVKQILTFSRQADQKLFPLKICPIIKDSLKLLRSTTPTTVSIVQNIGQERSKIMADSTQITQVLMNLCSNAIYAMDEKGTLEVTGTMVELKAADIVHQPDIKPGHYFKLSVSDTGTGIPREIQEQIFDPFYTTKEVNEGTGMGLSMVLGIVKSHGGFIQVVSEPGEGTIFTIYFPVIADAQVQEIEEVIEDIPQGKERILFVDDEEMLAILGGRMLERLGYEVTVNSSSNDALETFKANPEKFDMVITDQSMPNMSGAELAVELLKTRPDIPIILCTGYSKKISEEEAKRLGIRKYLIKPLERRQLAKFVREALE